MTGRSMKKPRPSVIWPVDAFQCDDRMVQRVAVALIRFFGADVPPVRPVYVLTPSATPFSSGWFEDLLPSFRQDAEERLAQVLKDVPFPVEAPKILVGRNGHSGEVIKLLNSFARQAKATLIVIPTRGRAGVARFLMGSFAESMLLYTKTPLLTVNSKLERHSRRQQRCLLPVDFVADDAAKGVERTLATLGRKDVEVIFCHATPPNLKSSRWPDRSILVHSRKLIVSHLSEEQERCRKLGDQLVARAERAGFKAKNILSLSLHSVPDAIVEVAASESVDFIAMASESTRLSVAFTGGVTRKVVRMAPCPVWALSSAVMPEK